MLYREITTQGFDGKEGIVKNYLRQFKPDTEEEVVRFETPPGQQMQVDFTTIRRGHNKLKGFVATLGFSRAIRSDIPEQRMHSPSPQPAKSPLVRH